MIKDSVTDEVIVVVAGGQETDYRYAKLFLTEMFKPGAPSGWTPGPDLPNALTGGKIVATVDGKSLIFIGGSDVNEKNTSEMLKLTCSSSICSWETMVQRLDFGRRNFVAMLVPENLVNCS